MNEPKVKISKICHDKNYGSWYAIGTERGWIEIRITPTGFIRVDPTKDIHKGNHYYFTPKKGGRT